MHKEMATLSSVHFEVNGRPVSAELGRGRTLMGFLRDELRLTGTKDGCSQGDCGACMVIINGEAVAGPQTKRRVLYPSKTVSQSLIA